MAVSQLTFLASQPGATYATRSGNFTADANGFITGVPLSGTAATDLLSSGCCPLVSSPSANFRNVLDGGDMTVNPFQRNIPGLAAANIISAAITNTPTYFADRWFGVGGASSSLLMSQIADATVPGFNLSLFHYRTASNSNVTPLNLGQVVEQADAIKLQGQQVTFSFWARPGATYSGGALTVAVFAGTGTVSNGSAANMVAGTWTGQSNVVNTTQVMASTMTRYNFSGVVPVGATQVGVMITYTPVGTASGATDGIFMNGAQLEIGGLSPFEHRDIQVELEICQRYAWSIPEPAAAVIVASGHAVASNSHVFYMAAPVQFRTAPTVTTAVGSFKVNSSTAGIVAATGLAAQSGGHTPNALSMVSTGTGTAGQGSVLQGGGGAGYILANADF